MFKVKRMCPEEPVIEVSLKQSTSGVLIVAQGRGGIDYSIGELTAVGLILYSGLAPAGIPVDEDGRIKLVT